MNQLFPRALPLYGLLLLAGCAPGAVVAPHGTDAAIWLQPQIHDTGYRAQAAESALTQTNINHLQIKIFKLVNSSEVALVGIGGEPMMLDLPQASLSTPVTFSNLNYDTQYRIRAYAYGDPETATLISTTDSGSYVDVTVAHEDRPGPISLPVQLTDVLFNGQATSSAVAVTGGSLAHPGAVGMDLTP